MADRCVSGRVVDCGVVRAPNFWQERERRGDDLKWSMRSVSNAEGLQCSRRNEGISGEARQRMRCHDGDFPACLDDVSEGCQSLTEDDPAGRV
jgi:hypothetical protein